MGADMRLGVLVSGGGTNLQAILDAVADGRLAAEVAVVISDRPGVFALERARKAGVPTAVHQLRDYPDRDSFSRAVADELQQHGADWVVLAGWLKIFTAPFLSVYAGRTVNTHPALLPSFGGPGMYGHHVHEVDAGPVIAQVAVPVLDGDTPDTLAARILPEEHRALVTALGWLAAGRVKVEGRHVVIRDLEEAAR
ncbi:MAG: phosphoribosylglycinamide formyltransferase [Armatimonadetes bacterium]|nr:phosphoribosylglycinamide formyltransferase [Armatimonadota bacterium]